MPILVIILLIKLTLTIQVYENINEDTTDIPNVKTTALTSTTTTGRPSSRPTESPEQQATVTFKQNNENKKTPTTYATRKPLQNLSTAVTKLHTMTTASFKHNV